MQRKIRLEIPYRGDKELSRIAHEFLEEMGQNDEPPIDIELVCDQLGISILTVPRLKQDLGIDAYIQSDFKAIVIDEKCFINHPQRARFSIAHELAHMLLHRDVYEQFEITSLDDYLKKQNRLHPDTEKRIEVQAYRLAGLILVPHHLLERSANDHGLLEEIVEFPLHEVEQFLVWCTETFDVSNPCIMRRFRDQFPAIYAKLMVEF